MQFVILTEKCHEGGIGMKSEKDRTRSRGRNGKNKQTNKQ